MTDDKLNELRRLAFEATRGPWVYLRGGEDLKGLRDGCALINTEAETRTGLKSIALLRDDDSVAVCLTQGKAEIEWANAAFIAAADPQTVTALIAEIKMLRFKLAEADDE